MGKTKSEPLVLERRAVTRVQWMGGLKEAARRLGVDPGHLTRVLSGERKSARLMAKMARLGIIVRGA